MRIGPAVLPFDLSPRAAAVLLLAVLLGAAALRVRLLSLPLERDEGEYAYIGWLMLHGVSPYSEAYTMKLPGIHVAYAGILAIFGHSPAAIRTGLLLINLTSVTLIYLLSRQLFSRLAGIGAAATYAVLSVGPAVHGVIANAEHFVIAPMLAGVLLLIRYDSVRPSIIFTAGLCLGLAFLVKQPALVFIVLGIGLLVGSFRSKGSLAPFGIRWNVAVFLSGALLPLAATCVWMTWAGTLNNFWRWTFEYPLGYASQVTWSEGIEKFLRTGTPIATFAAPTIVVSILGIVFAIRYRGTSPQGIFLAAFTLFSFLAVCPGLHFREHYFLFLVPPLGVATGAWVHHMARRGRKKAAIIIPLGFVAASLAWSVYLEREILFRLPLDQASRLMYGDNPFVESSAIGEYIAKATPPESRVAILGSEPQILFHAQRRSATGFLYMYPLTEQHRFTEVMQRQLISEVEAVDPELIVMVSVPTSWLYRLDSSMIVVDWWNNDVPERYQLEGIFEIGAGRSLQMLRGAEAEQFASRAPLHIKVLRRRPSVDRERSLKPLPSAFLNTFGRILDAFVLVEQPDRDDIPDYCRRTELRAYS